MRNKLYLLLAVLSIIVMCALATDEASKQSDSKADVTKTAGTAAVEDKADTYDKDNAENDDEDNEVDDSHLPRSTYAHNRFVSHNSPEDNYRTRSRWPAASALPPSPFAAAAPFSIGEYTDDDDDNDWSSAGYGSAFPTSFSPNSHKMHGMSHNDPSCNSLIDTQYPIFSDTCGAVPQARYSLPNALGQREKWQVAQLLNVLMSSSTEPTCTRSLRLLLCPILFPSCSSRHQAPPVLPCQSFCRAVKSRCAIPILESLPCEVLPYSSDLCPTNQLHGPFAPPRAFPNNMQSSPMAAGHPSSRQYSTLQSLLSSPALQAALSAQGFPSGLTPQTLQAALSAHAFQPALSAQAFQPALPAQAFHVPSPFAAQSVAPAAPVTTTPPPPPPPQPVAATPRVNTYNTAQFPTNSIPAMTSDFGARTYGNEYRQGPRYGPLMRSSNDARPAADLRASAETRQQIASRPRNVAYSSPTAHPPTSSSMVRA